MVGHRLLTGNSRNVFSAAAIATAAVVGCSLAMAACGSESEESANLEATTYNAGLAYGFVPYAKERQADAVKAIAGLNSDVVCLQEVWTDEDIAAVETAAKAAGFSDVHYKKTPEDVTGLPIACTKGDTDKLLPCAQKHCAKSTVGELAACVTGKCQKEFDSIASTCSVCLASNLGKPLDTIVGICTKAGGKYSYGGYNGLMLLSRIPLKNAAHVELKSVLTRRGLLTADIDAPSPIGSVHVMCTHLTANLSAIDYPDKGSWEAEQSKQIDEIVKRGKGKSGRVVLLGDMNTGPKLDPGIVAELPKNYDKLIAGGFAPTYAVNGATCTFCSSNTLVSGGADKGGEAAVIDHVMTMGEWTKSSAKRVLDGKVTIKVGGKDEQHDISDHYGITASLEVTKAE